MLDDSHTSNRTTAPREPPSGSETLFGVPKSGTVLGKRYRLDEKIGRGGMGAVFRGWDLALERRVAVKVLIGPAVEEETSRRRFLREARAAAALSHSNVVSVHDVGEDAGLPFLVMELVDGMGLHRWETRSLEDVIEIALQICDALAHAHGQGLVHRDLKPENVLVAGGDGRATAIKIVDLGLALTQRGIRLTREGEIAGTVLYMAPEQALGKTVDGRADLYSLGVMLYEMVTGRLPFTAPHPLAVLSQHLQAPVVPPSTYREDLAPALEAVILRLMAKDPDERYTSAPDVAQALRAALGEAQRVAGAAANSAASPPSPQGALKALARGRLVGRDHALDELRRAWSAAREGEGGVVLLAGEPGAGKSRLARELANYVRITGGEALVGGSYEYEASAPYLPFVEALRRFVHRRRDHELGELLGDAASDLARLAPEIESRLGPFPQRPAQSAHEDRLRLFDAVARFLRALAAHGGLLLFVDDLQWADEGTLSLIHYLLRLLRGDKVLLLGAYRDTELDGTHALADAMESWNRERVATTLYLDRLEAAQTTALLATLLSQEEVTPGFAERVYRETEGNPFFVEELVKALVEEGQIVKKEGGWHLRRAGELVLPKGVQEALRRRLDRVGASCGAVLRLAAVLGKTFSFDELDAVSEASEDALLDALDEAVEAQLLVAGEGESFVFTHDKFREVLLTAVNPVRRRRLHGRVASGLVRLEEARGGVAVEDLAYHFVEAGEHRRGLDYAVKAARAAEAVYVHSEAADNYERALGCAEALGDASLQLDLLISLAKVHDAQGALRRAADAYRQAVGLGVDPEREHWLWCRIGECYIHVGDDRGMEWVRRVLDEVDAESHPAELVDATMVEARYHHLRGRSAQAAELLLGAHEVAERTGAGNLVNIYTFLAGAYQHLTRFGESNGWARRCLELGEKLGDPGIQAYGCEFLAENALFQGHWREALEHSDRETSLAHKIRSGDRLGWAQWARGKVLFYMGELDESEAVLREGVETAGDIGESRLEAFNGIYRCMVLAELGRADEAVRESRKWMEHVDGLNLTYHRVEARRAAAYVALRRGDPSTVLELWLEMKEILVDSDEALCPMFFGVLAAEAAIATGQRQLSAEVLEETLDQARRAGAPHWEGVALRVRGALAADRDDPEAARRDLDSAVAIFEDIGSGVELARALEQRTIPW